MVPSAAKENPFRNKTKEYIFSHLLTMKKSLEEKTKEKVRVGTWDDFTKCFRCEETTNLGRNHVAMFFHIRGRFS
jgi:hypothetical protein